MACNGITHYTKVEFHSFDGHKVKEWVYKAEQFFDVDQTVEGAKVNLASTHFERKEPH